MSAQPTDAEMSSSVPHQQGLRSPAKDLEGLLLEKQAMENRIWGLQQAMQTQAMQTLRAAGDGGSTTATPATPSEGEGIPIMAPLSPEHGLSFSPTDGGAPEQTTPQPQESGSGDAKQARATTHAESSAAKETGWVDDDESVAVSAVSPDKFDSPAAVAHGIIASVRQDHTLGDYSRGSKDKKKKGKKGKQQQQQQLVTPASSSARGRRQMRANVGFPSPKASLSASKRTPTAAKRTPSSSSTRAVTSSSSSSSPAPSAHITASTSRLDAVKILRATVSHVRRYLRPTSTIPLEWTETVDLLHRIHECCVDGLNAAVTIPTLVGLLAPLLPSLQHQLTSQRSKVITQACSSIGTLAKTLEGEFSVFCPLVRQLTALTRDYKKVISLNADKCVRDIVLSCQHREVLYALFGVLQEEIKNGNEQEKCVGYLALILKSWTDPDSHALLSAVQANITKITREALDYPVNKVREQGRAVFVEVLARFPEAAMTLYENSTTFVQELVLEEYPQLTAVLGCVTANKQQLPSAPVEGSSGSSEAQSVDSAHRRGQSRGSEEFRAFRQHNKGKFKASEDKVDVYESSPALSPAPSSFALPPSAALTLSSSLSATEADAVDGGVLPSPSSSPSSSSLSPTNTDTVKADTHTAVSQASSSTDTTTFQMPPISSSSSSSSSSFSPTTHSADSSPARHRDELGIVRTDSPTHTHTLAPASAFGSPSGKEKKKKEKKKNENKMRRVVGGVVHGAISTPAHTHTHSEAEEHKSKSKLRQPSSSSSSLPHTSHITHTASDNKHNPTTHTHTWVSSGAVESSVIEDASAAVGDDGAHTQGQMASQLNVFRHSLRSARKEQTALNQSVDELKAKLQAANGRLVERDRDVARTRLMMIREFKRKEDSMLDDVEQRLVGVLEKKELECDGEVLRMKQSMEALNIEKRGLLTQLHSMNHKLKAFESRMGRMREQNHLDSSILTHKHDVEQSVKAQLQLQHQRELRAEQEQVAALQKKLLEREKEVAAAKVSAASRSARVVNEKKKKKKKKESVGVFGVFQRLQTPPSKTRRKGKPSSTTPTRATTGPSSDVSSASCSSSEGPKSPDQQRLTRQERDIDSLNHRIAALEVTQSASVRVSMGGSPEVGGGERESEWDVHQWLALHRHTERDDAQAMVHGILAYLASCGKKGPAQRQLLAVCRQLHTAAGLLQDANAKVERVKEKHRAIANPSSAAARTLELKCRRARESRSALLVRLDEAEAALAREWGHLYVSLDRKASSASQNMQPWRADNPKQDEYYASERAGTPSRTTPSRPVSARNPTTGRGVVYFSPSASSSSSSSRHAATPVRPHSARAVSLSPSKKHRTPVRSQVTSPNSSGSAVRREKRLTSSSPPPPSSSSSSTVGGNKRMGGMKSKATAGVSETVINHITITADQVVVAPSGAAARSATTTTAAVRTPAKRKKLPKREAAPKSAEGETRASSAAKKATAHASPASAVWASAKKKNSASQLKHSQRIALPEDVEKGGQLHSRGSGSDFDDGRSMAEEFKSLLYDDDAALLDDAVGFQDHEGNTTGVVTHTLAQEDAGHTATLAAVVRADRQRDSQRVMDDAHTVESFLSEADEMMAELANMDFS